MSFSSIMCIKCDQNLSHEHFYSSSLKKHNFVCKICSTRLNREYKQNNKEKINKINSLSKKKNKIKNNAKIAEKRKSDPIFKLTENVRTLIKNSLRDNKGKKADSSLKYVEYTIGELKNHLEKLFEPWMTWQNWGRYDSSIWKDNDQTTWTWQIDHIIPRKNFNYISLEDESFKKCWSLDNLRPLSAKQNIINGANLRGSNVI